MKVLILDNYDSFTYNLYQTVGEILKSADKKFVLNVKRNDKITLAQIKQAHYDRIIISPGPGSPADREYFGVCADVLLKSNQTTPILGVCLGMQGIAYYFGGQIIRAPVPLHGKTSLIKHDGHGIFTGLPSPLEVMRYHSLVVNPRSVPDCLAVTATAASQIMGLRHRLYPIEGIQFHPESFATEGGKQMLKNFLSING